MHGGADGWLVAGGKRRIGLQEEDVSEQEAAHHHKPELKVKERQILPQGHRAFTVFISKPFCDQHFVNFSDCSGKKKGSKQEMKNTAD